MRLGDVLVAVHKQEKNRVARLAVEDRGAHTGDRLRGRERYPFEPLERQQSAGSRHDEEGMAASN